MAYDYEKENYKICPVCKKVIDYHIHGFIHYEKENVWVCRDHTIAETTTALGKFLTKNEKKWILHQFIYSMRYMLTAWEQANYERKKVIHWTFMLGNGKEVTVDYCPRWSYCYEDNLKYRTDHFEFRGAAISSTGYRSEFANANPDPEYDGEQEAYEFAKKKIVELSGVGFDEWEGQLPLF